MNVYVVDTIMFRIKMIIYSEIYFKLKYESKNLKLLTNNYILYICCIFNIQFFRLLY